MMANFITYTEQKKFTARDFNKTLKRLMGLEPIEGLDISHWQGKLTADDVAKMKAKHVRFVWVKFSQGTSYRDDCAGHNTRLLQAAGIAVGPYHFVTTAPGGSQSTWFKYCMQGFTFQLPPMLDCEAYLPYSENLIKEARRVQATEPEVEIVKELRFAKPPLKVGLTNAVRGYVYTTEAIVDILGEFIAAWMRGQQSLAAFKYPAIYTNVGSGNVIFKGKISDMARYPLDVANWGVAVPSLPKVWKDAGGKYLAWQNAVIPGNPYGIDGSVDHQQWGNLMDFPGDVTDPEPPPSVERKIIFKLGDVKWEGTAHKMS